MSVTKYSRRAWSNLVLNSIGAVMLPSVLLSNSNVAAKGASVLGADGKVQSALPFSVILGIQTYSFRDLDLDDTIKAMVALGIKSCELWEGHVEPRELQWRAGQTPEESKKKNEDLKMWRANLDVDYIKNIRNKFNKAGIAIMAYCGTMKDAINEEDMEVVFKITEALGTKIITTSATVSVMKRVDVYARKYKIQVGMHNHSHVDKPNEFSSPESFARAMEGLSDYICINLDIGHFTAAGFDAVAFIKQHHEKIVCLHIKDRKRNQGPNQPFGMGDTPITEVLRLIRDNRYPFPADIEYEYKGADTVAEVKKCLDYCKNALKA